MRFSIASVLTLASAASAAAVQGFNYGATLTTGAPRTYSDFVAAFNQARGLQGTNGAFTSARLYTSIQAGTTNTPSEAFQAAIDTDTHLLLGLWASAGDSAIQNEIAAIQSFIGSKGQSFLTLIDGISVGSEDLYRTSPIGIKNKSGVGALAPAVASYISQVKQAIGRGILVGHVDTYTAWIQRNSDNSLTNQAVIDASDFIGTDAYPYFQNTEANGIAVGLQLFDEALGETRAAVGSKPIWITETGWPVSGPTMNQAVASIANAKTYWDAVACKYLGNTNTWWYTLQDATPDTPSPSFGLVGAAGGETPLYDLTCPGKSSSSSSSSSRSSTSKTSTSAAGSSGAGSSSSSTSAAAAAGSSGAAAAAGTTGKSAGTTVEMTTYTTTTECPVTVTSGNAVKTVVSTDTLTITSCKGGCPSATAVPAASTAAAPQSAAPQSSAAAPAPAPASPTGACPAALSGTYEYPHLIVPVDSTQKDKAFGTSYNGSVSATVSSIFNFDIPSANSDKECTLVFLFPEQKDLQTSSFTTSGSGGIKVSGLKAPADQSTTFANAPAVTEEVGSVKSVTPGNSYTISTGKCAAGERIGYEVSATGDFALNYFQDYNPSPIGMYVTIC